MCGRYYILLLFPFLINAQDSSPIFFQVTAPGIEIGEVRAIFMDDERLLWVGGASGLYTYDGIRVEKVLSGNIYSVFRSGKDDVYIGTDSKIQRYNPLTRVKTNIHLDPINSFSGELFFQDFHEDTRGILWASSYNGLYKVEGDSSTNVLIEPNLQQIQVDPYYNRLNKIEQHYHPDSLYISTLKGLYVFNIIDHTFKKYTHNQVITNDIKSKEDTLYIAEYWKTIDVLTQNGTKINQINTPEGAVINSILPDTDKIWIATSQGLFSYDDKLHFHQDAAKPLFSRNLPSCNVLLKDSMGHIWGGFENGLYLLDEYRNILKSYAASTLLKHSHAKIYNVQPFSNGRFLLSSNIDYPKIYTPGNIENNARNQNEIIYYLEDTLFLVINQNTVSRYNPISNKKTVFSDENLFKNGDFKYYLSHTYYPELDLFIMGRQWGRGITVLDLKTGIVKKYDQSQMVSAEEFSATGFDYLLTDEDAKVYFTSAKGLGTLDLLNGKINFLSLPNSSTCSGIAKDSKGQIFAVFYGEGLYKLKSSKTELVEVLKLKDINRITIDIYDKIWATSTSGAYLINPYNKEWLILTKEEGFPKNNISGAHLTGLSTSEVVIENSDWLAVGNSNALHSSLKHNTQPFLIEKDGLFYTSSRNFKPPSLMKYEYSLHPEKNKWTNFNPSLPLSFPELAPGRYDLVVRTSFASNPWRESIPIRIAIPYPWWKRWYVIAITTLIAILIIALYVRQIRRQDQLKSRMKTLEMQSLRAQMNPHFIFNAMNSIKHYILKNDKLLAAEFLGDFSMLIRKILSHSASEVISLQEELETLKLYIEMEQTRFLNKFDFILNVESGLDLDLISIPPLILQPYVENAIWHGLLQLETKGKLTLNIKSNNHLMIYEIIDDGIGRKKASEIKSKSALKSKSMGMKITKERIQSWKNKGEVIIEDLIKGTKVSILIPIQ